VLEAGLPPWPAALGSTFRNCSGARRTEEVKVRRNPGRGPHAARALLTVADLRVRQIVTSRGAPWPEICRARTPRWAGPGGF